MSPIELPYEVEGRDYRGYLVDGSGGRRAPGVLLAHEAGGFTEHVLERARMMAEAGYVALAMDTFGEPVRDRAHAIALMTALTDEPERLRSRATGALEALRGLPNVDRGRIAAIGFCFGGTTVLDLARSGADVAAVVSFHGGLATDDPKLGRHIKAAVLAMNGADDTGTMPDAPAFRAEMQQSPADWEFVVFGHAVHCFTEVGDNSPGCRYDAKIAARAYRLMHDWLGEAFAAKGKR